MAFAWPCNIRSPALAWTAWNGTDASWAFFDTMIADGQYLPEDYSFCRRWRQIGGEIWIDLQSRFDHVGSYVYRGDLGVTLVGLRCHGSSLLPNCMPFRN